MKIFFSVLLMFLCCSTQVLAELNPLLKSTMYQDKNIRVIRVLTPDLILLQGDERVKLIGLVGVRTMQPPKEERDEYGFIIQRKVDPATTAEENAFHYAKGLLEGKMVRLEFDTQKKDEQRILQAYVFLENGDFVNELLLKQGAAHLKIVPPNMKYADQLRKAYQEARREMRGLQGQW